ncbi:MAG: insulinase family protein [Anaerolineaceae bacterium]|nr:insulinase family protein [Anaerolineaceae bacterium]
MTSINLDAYRSLPGPETITRVELENGIVVLARENRHSAAVSIAGYLGAGSYFDPPERRGLADFVARALKYGTAERSFQEINQALESVGASLGFSASVRSINFGGRALAEDLPLLFDLLRDCAMQPSFPEKMVQMLKDQLLTSLQIREQDTREMASMNFDRMLFGDHPYAFPEDGYAETVEIIGVEDLRAFHQQYFGPKNMVIAVTGGMKTDALIDLARRKLGGWRNEAQELVPVLDAPKPLERPIREHLTIPGKFQTDLVMGTFGPSRLSYDYLTCVVGNNILGQFGLMGRIGDVVRDQAGLAYHASTSLNASRASGSWVVNAGVNPANLERAIDLIRQELEKFRTAPVWPEELEDSKANLIGRLPLSLESNSGVAYLLLRIERFGLGLTYLHDYVRLVGDVTAEEILEAAARYFDFNQLVISSAGPALMEEE